MVFPETGAILSRRCRTRVKKEGIGHDGRPVPYNRQNRARRKRETSPGGRRGGRGRSGAVIAENGTGIICLFSRLKPPLVSFSRNGIFGSRIQLLSDQKKYCCNPLFSLKFLRAETDKGFLLFKIRPIGTRFAFIPAVRSYIFMERIGILFRRARWRDRSEARSCRRSFL